MQSVCLTCHVQVSLDRAGVPWARYACRCPQGLKLPISRPVFGGGARGKGETGLQAIQQYQSIRKSRSTKAECYPRNDSLPPKSDVPSERLHSLPGRFRQTTIWGRDKKNLQSTKKQPPQNENTKKKEKKKRLHSH